MSACVRISCLLKKMLLFFIWIYLLYIAVLVSSIHKSELATCIPVFSPSWTSTPLGHLRALNCKLPALISRIPLAICFTRGSAHMAIPVSQFILPPSPLVHPSVFYACVSILP